LETLRESIGYVSQEPVLILGSIRDNLLFGKSDATDADLREALTKANALFAYDIDANLNAFIGSTSVMNLSGGQK
jgi:ABC-type multidrug transport system fused ATPase/permease subunit